MSLWGLMTALVGCSITMYLYFRYVWLLSLSPLANFVFLVLFILAGLSPLFVTYKYEDTFGSFYPLYRYILYFIFISCVILLTLTLVLDTIWFVGYKLGWLECTSFSRDFCQRFNLLTIAAALIISGYSLYEGTKVPEVKEVEILSDKISQDKKIVLLTDIHIHRVISPEKVRQIVERTNALEPDIILLAGDIIDDDIGIVGETAALLKGLKAKDGIYFVSGNHEFYSGYRDSLVQMKKLGFKTIENSGVDLGDLFIAGIPDWRTSQRLGLIFDTQTAFAKAKPEQYKILMSHTPFDMGQDNHFDLVVSGHTHGGQIFPFHILSALHNKYLAGLYNIDNNAQIYVSRGAGQWGPQMRFLAPSEITLIKLISNSKKETNNEL